MNKMKLEIHIQIDKEDDGRIVYDVDVWDDEAMEHDDNYCYYGCESLEEAKEKLNQIVLMNPKVEWDILDEDIVGWCE